ncbi:multidrug effflux MFS transporter [Polymorphum gilvum]|uniref:Bcr/CflA family efflux transporter n=1 Tax=Polymorphum gilvum (strain LMG 25793 / CGMCC 1.9160 / SL003B-26A1) TaxID=991905 RepID=F2J0C6_POLGS|nr:multidrug effflux MFS transporter [Polymorphum gilvum]ADZ68660.1 Drug resistance transporter, Bcr/CflA subfamily [Polymorphum gilvum SL003B-26A1]
MSAATAALMSERRTAILGAALVAIGPITMALYTPAMPALAAAFGTSASMVKLTLTAYFAGFALTQLVCGPLTDAYGRRPVTLIFMALYLVSTLLATFAPTIEWMIAARTLQGVGAAIGISVSRAIVRDQFTGQTAARIMNTIAMMLALGPALSPSVGGLTLELFGWREIFIFMTLYGVVLTLAVVVFMRETNAYIDPANIRIRRLVVNYAALLKDPRFLQPSLLIGFGIGTIYAIATVLPFVLIDRVGLSPSAFGFGMLAQSGSFIAGTVVTGRLLKRIEAGRLVPASLVGMTLAALAMIVSLTMLPPGFLSVMGPVALFAFSITFMLPAATVASLQGFPHMAGAASSLTGFLQFGSGILGSLCAAALGDPLLGMAVIGPGMPLLAVGAYLLLGPSARRHGLPAE